MKIQSQHLIYLVLPGLVLFLVDQSMFIGLRGRMLPAAAAVAYCVVFAVIAIGGLALNFVVRRANPDLAVQRLAFIASMVLAIGCLANLASTGGQLSSRQLLYFAAIGLALAIGILATKRLLGFSSRALAAMALLAVAVLWAMAFPERDGLVEPYSYLQTTAVLVVLTATLFGITDDLGLPARWLGASLGGLVAIAMVLQVVGQLAEAGQAKNDKVPPAKKLAASGRPNVLFIVWDTVRKDHLSLYGYERSTTPYLEERAAESAVYTSAVSVAPYTPPAHASMFTGLYPTTHGLHNVGGGIGLVRKFVKLPDELVTLAEAVHAHGYATGAVSANFGFVGRLTNLHQGFTFFDDSRNPDSLIRHFELQSWLFQKLSPWMSKGFRHDYLSPSPVAAKVTSKALRWLDSVDRDQPFFLFLNYMDAHDPFFPPPDLVDRFPGFDPHLTPFKKVQKLVAAGEFDEAARQHAISQYDAGIVHLDRELRHLEQELEKRGVYDNTLIVLTSDHGEFLGDHDLYGHGKHLYSGNIDVPLIIRFPHAAEVGEYAGPIENRHLYRLVLDTIGIPNDADGPTDEVYAEQYGSSSAKPWRRTVLFDDHYKLISEPDGVDELFDLARDPSESVNLESQMLDVLTRGKVLLEAFENQNDGRAAVLEQKELSEDDLDRLRSLGYAE